MEKKRVMNVPSPTVADEFKEIASCELNELGLTKEQALKLDIFKLTMGYTKNVTTSFTVTDTIIRWLLG